jgi:hypothetical protein
MNSIICPSDSTHTIRNAAGEHPDIGGVTWYDCKQCNISFAVGYKWPDEHPKWSEDLANEEG